MVYMLHKSTRADQNETRTKENGFYQEDAHETRQEEEQMVCILQAFIL